MLHFSNKEKLFKELDGVGLKFDLCHFLKSLPLQSIPISATKYTHTKSNKK